MAALGPVAVGSLLWRHRGGMHLTAVVKAQFAMRPDHPMEVVDAPQLVARDVHEDDDPTRSLIEASDMVPFRPKADVWLRGHAQTPGPPVSVLLARLALYRKQQALLDKVLQVVGDRAHGEAAPQPFERMPLVYERAYGGIGHEDNPVGRGHEGSARPPNLLVPHAGQTTACFAPVSPYWQSRRKHLAGSARPAGSVLAVPEGVTWPYFQAAPADQQLAYLRGGEWLVLDGLDATAVRLQSRIPKLTAELRLIRRADDDVGDRLAVVADCLAIDTDARICTITWRGSVSVRGDESPAQWLIAAALAGEGQRIDWSAARQHALAADTVLDDSTTRPGAEPASDDPLGRTTVDPITAPAPPSFGEAPWDDEVTELRDRPLEGETGKYRQPDELVAPAPTEPGQPPVFEEDDLPWIHEDASEPPPAQPTERGGISQPIATSRADAPASSRRRGPSSDARLSSLPPAPLDLNAYLAGLRQAGATEEDVKALLEQLERSRRE